MERLFVYGTLKDPAVQQRVFGRLAPLTPDELDGYAMTEVRLGLGTYAMIVPDPEAATPIAGATFEVTAAELANIDRYETSAYARVRVALRSGAAAWVYVRNEC